MQPGPPNSPAPLPPQAQRAGLAAPPSFPPLFQSLAVVGTLCLVLNQSSSTIDLETVRSATAEALGVWDARVVNPSISTPCFFYPLWCEKQSLEQSIQSLPLQAGVAGVTFSAHENEVRVPLGGTIPIPFSTLANDGASDATSTVVSLELVDYKPSVSQRRTPTSPLCLAEDTCDFCACKNMCYTGMLGKLYGSSGDGAGFSRSAVDALESASGVGVQFASFDSLLSVIWGGEDDWAEQARISLVLWGLPAWLTVLAVPAALLRRLRRWCHAQNEPVEAMVRDACTRLLDAARL